VVSTDSICPHHTSFAAQTLTLMDHSSKLQAVLVLEVLEQLLVVELKLFSIFLSEFFPVP